MSGNSFQRFFPRRRVRVRCNLERKISAFGLRYVNSHFPFTEKEASVRLFRILLLGSFGGEEMAGAGRCFVFLRFIRFSMWRDDCERVSGTFELQEYRIATNHRASHANPHKSRCHTCSAGAEPGLIARPPGKSTLQCESILILLQEESMGSGYRLALKRFRRLRR